MTAGVIVHPLSTFVKQSGFIPYVGTDAGDGRDGRQTIKGPQRDRVAANVRELRDLRRMTLAELSARLRVLGHPLRSTAIHKIEQRERKVDADDLVAIALALDVSPNRLLLTGTAAVGVDIQLTSEVTVDELSTWRWARGKQTLYGLLRSQKAEEKAGVQFGREMYRRRVEFPLVNRPDVPPDPPTVQVGPHWGELQDLWRSASELADKIGCSLEAVLRLIPDARIIEAARVHFPDGDMTGWEEGSDGR